MHKTVCRQYFATVVANIPTFIFGMSISWCSPYIPLLMSDSTSLECGPLTESEVSWIASGSSIGGIFSCLIFGLLLDLIGRKGCLFVLALPQMLSWVCIQFATTGTLILIGRVLSGISGAAAFMATPVFVSEIAGDDHRGVLGSFFALSCNFGIFFGFILTSNVTYERLPIVLEVLSMLYVLLILIVPESPNFHRMKGCIEKDEKSQKYYGHKSALNVQKAVQQKNPNKLPINWKPILLSILLAAASSSSGVFLIIGFAQSIFDESGSMMSSDTASVVIAVLQVMGGYVSVVTIEKIGRRTLLLSSAMISCVCLFITGAYYYLKHLEWDVSVYSFTPVLFLSILFFVTSIGLASVPFIVITEILPQKLRGKIHTIAMSSVDISIKNMSRGVRRQYFATIVANLQTIFSGISKAWTSPYVPLLMSDDTPLNSGPLTEDEVSWIAAGGSIGALLGTVIFGILLLLIGRKRCLLVSAIPQCVSWFLFYIAPSSSLLFIGRVLQGTCTGCAVLVTPVFVAEISDNKNRGILGSFLTLANNIGILVGFLFTSCLSYHQVSIASIVLSIVYAILIVMVAESPAYCEMRERDASKSYEYYGWQKPVELSLLRGCKKSMVPVKSNVPRIASYKPIFLALMLGTFVAFSGNILINAFSTTIFAESGSNISTDMSSLVVAVIQIIGAYGATITIEKWGRRSLLLLCSFSSSLCFFATGVYYFVKSIGVDTTIYSFLPLMFLSLILFVGPLGLTSVPFVMAPELLPQRLRGPVLTLSMIELWGLVILGYRFFLPTVDLIGMHGFMWFFASTTLFMGIFTYLFLPETKGKSLGSIANLFDRRTQNDVDQ